MAERPIKTDPAVWELGGGFSHKLIEDSRACKYSVITRGAPYRLIGIHRIFDLYRLNHMSSRLFSKFIVGCCRPTSEESAA